MAKDGFVFAPRHEGREKVTTKQFMNSNECAGKLNTRTALSFSHSPSLLPANREPKKLEDVKPTWSAYNGKLVCA